MKLILIRHGQTQENADGVIQGWINSTLNETGQRQAKAAAANLDESIDAIYSSDLTRCRQTAQYFRDKYPDTPYAEDERIRERNFGDAQGTHKALHDWEVFWASDDEVSIPNAEKLNDFTARVRAFLVDIKAKHSDSDQVLVVAHGGSIKRILNILKLSDTNHQLIQNADPVYVDLTDL